MNHPDKSELSDFILGKLAADQAETVEVHLSDCLNCQQTLLNLSVEEDTFVNALRGGLGRQSEPQDLCADGPFLLRDYQLLEQLGRGGMGTVYRARHLKLGRLVALKVLPPERITDPELIARFQREMQAVGALDHRNIVRAYDAGEVDGHHFLVMELIDGVDLARLVADQGPLRVSDACEIIRQAAAGLEHAHQHGLVHRDIKPSNLMIAAGTPAVVKVLDLGLARMLDANDHGIVDSGGEVINRDHRNEVNRRRDTVDGSLTTTHQLMGTPDYMSPEQCTNVRHVDIRSDIYSLGATLYKLLTGHATHCGPRYGTLAAKIRGVSEDAPAPMTHDRNDLPAELRSIVDRMLSKQPQHRFASPGEVARALAPLARGHRIDRLVNATTARGRHDHSESTAQIHRDNDPDVPRRDTRNGPLPWRIAAVGVASGLLLLMVLAPSTSPTAGRNENQSAAPSEQPSTGGESPPSAEVAGVVPPNSAVDSPPTTSPPRTVYCSTSISDLVFAAAPSAGLTAEQRKLFSGRGKSMHWIWTHPVLDGAGEIYLSPPRQHDSNGTARLVACVSEPEDRTGRLMILDPSSGKVIELPFTLTADRWTADHRQAFLETKLDHYDFLSRQDLPGSAWFHYQSQTCERALAGQPSERPPLQPATTPGRVDSTYELLSGATAISENLQLDRVIQSRTASGDLVPVDEIEGITVDEIDWSTWRQGDPPPLDYLASIIPFDQHAFLFSSFSSLLNTLEHAQKEGLVLISFAQLNLVETDTLEKYQRQRGLPLDKLTQLLGPQFVKSVAITGSDPYFDAGTDVAILFEPTDEETLGQLIAAQIALSVQTRPGDYRVAGQIEGVNYNGYVTPDRSLCTYQASIEGVVVVTNSLVQLRRLIDVAQGKNAALASLPEYHFFRSRYPIAQETQAGLLVVSDATIRRWCGPRWRIGNSRRLYANAALAAAQAEYVVAPAVEGRPVTTQQIDQFAAVAGPIFVDPHGAGSSIYGTRDFMTPIVELDLDRVNQTEAANYRIWKQQYERLWSKYFDPIAIRFEATPDSWSADVTVIPLRVQSRYQLLVNLTRGARINPTAIDRHSESLISWAMSIDNNSAIANIAGTVLAPHLPPQLQADPLGWMGSTAEMYVDDDPMWAEVPLSRLDLSDAFKRELLIALSVEVIDKANAVSFLDGLRAFIDQSTAGNFRWETRQHHTVTYLRMSEDPSKDQRHGGRIFTPETAYFAIAGDRLVISFNEACLQRAIERAVGGAPLSDSQSESTKPKAASAEWPLLGNHIVLHMQGPFHIPLQATMAGADVVALSRQASWRNLPILNEWKRFFPEQDPVAVHHRFWQRRLVCRGGGQYRWNPTTQSMESSVFGPPGQPLDDDYQLPLPLSDARSVSMGVTFEENGLRARMELQRAVGADAVLPAAD